ncbi:YwdI family protein [Metabacillus litoralis]|uniref:YwdI family protein n=1 Tax=Metabacillus litoralis TaxID=152268 RepID=UPI001CFD76C1|nr:YwdI family protein [Metabacillus litoralis]
MNIHVSKILTKMQDEIDKAKNSDLEHNIKEHIMIIQSLCDLIVENKSKAQTPTQLSSPISSEISPTELQKMMGNIPTVAKQKPGTEKSSTYKDEEANGHSLFDF